MKLLKLKTEKEVTGLLWLLFKAAESLDEKNFCAVIADRLGYNKEEFIQEE